MTDLTAGDIREIDGGTLSVFIDSIRGDVVSFTVVEGPNRMIGKGFKSSVDDLCDRFSDAD